MVGNDLRLQLTQHRAVSWWVDARVVSEVPCVRGPIALEYVGVGVVEVCACSANAIRGLGLRAAHFLGTGGRGLTLVMQCVPGRKRGGAERRTNQAGTTTPYLYAAVASAATRAPLFPVQAGQ